MLARNAWYPRRRLAGSPGPVQLFLAVLLLGLPLSRASAEATDEVPLTPSRERSFRIPFQTQPNERRLKEVQLLVSTDQGRTWRLAATAAPEQGFFQQFTAPQDGTYWFTVRTLDLQNRAFPATDAELRPGLKVLVDTVPPTVFLEALPPRDGSVGVRWDARDENLEPASIRLEYQAAGTNQWTPVRIDPVPSGQVYWQPAISGPLEVRLTILDTVRNVGKATIQIGSGGTGTSSGTPPPPGGFGPTGQAPMRIVNSKRISINYKIDEVGESGVSTVELWYTQDGKNWQKHSEDAQHKPPYVVDVNGEGVYGFTLVVRSGVGLSERPPQVGDAPQVWVEVDLTKPVVRLLSVDVGQGPATGSLNIAWSATDKNLGPTPITLAYAEQPDGPWTPITTLPIENSGRYIWHMPPGVPYQFLVRVEAADKAGNVGSAQTPNQVKVDLKKPKPTILDVSPAAGK